jgi:hypothetical protein
VERVLRYAWDQHGATPDTDFDDGSEPMITEAREQVRTATRRTARRRDATVETTTARAEESPRTIPRVVSVFRGMDGRLHHARCGHEVELVGVRGGIELDFHCLACWEHVTLTEAALTRVPVGQGAGA